MQFMYIVCKYNGLGVDIICKLLGLNVSIMCK